MGVAGSGEQVAGGRRTLAGNLLSTLTKCLNGRASMGVGRGAQVATHPGRVWSATAVVRDRRLEPVVIFEALCDRTRQIAWTTKFVEYCALASVQRYILLEPDWV